MEQEHRVFNGEIRNLQKKNAFIFEADLYALNEKPNRNSWKYTDIRGNKNQFTGTPVLIAYVNGGKTIGDGHNFRMEEDINGDPAPTFTDATAERVIGHISENPDEIRIEQDEEGTEWIVAKAYLWRWYAKEAVKKIELDTKMGQPMSLSIETLVSDSHMDGEIEVMDKYTILGTTILGDGVAPAVEDARILAINELASEFKELKLRAASYIQNSTEEDEKDEEGTDQDTIASNQEKPQAKQTESEVNTLNLFSKKQNAELAKKFNGYAVLSAGQDENGIHVCLLSDNGETVIYTMSSLEDTIVPENFVKTNAKVVFKADEWELEVDSTDITDSLAADLMKANTSIESIKSDLEKANGTIEAMKTAETKRRISACHAIATDTLNKFNANREEKVSMSILTKINECIDNGDFSECENAEGEWCGEEEVMNKVLAACAAEVMEFDRKAAQKNASQFVWDGINQKHANSEGGVNELLHTFGIQ